MSAPAAVLRVTTRLVVVDVVAVDKRGRTVPDLIADSFTLFEDGRPQRLRVFGFQRSQAGASTARHSALSLPPNVFTNIPSYNTNTALNVILLDSLNATVSNQVYAREQTLQYLETVPEGQPVAVYTLGSKLRLAVDFTDDIHALKEAIKKARVQESPFTAHPELDSSARRPGPIQQLLDVWARENFSFQTDLRVRYTLDALKALARTLSGYPGRKNLIWISETFPITIAPDAGTGLPNFEAARSYEPDVIRTTEALGDAQVAVYPVDARGLVVSSVYDGASQRTPPGTTPKWWEDGASVLASHDTMQELAQRTGGKAYYNRGDLDLMGTADARVTIGPASGGK
jgi:VWFA-related protein